MTSLQLLSKATTDCPECQGYDASLRSQGLDKDPRTGEKLCQRCDKNGKMPLIPGLRKALDVKEAQ